MISRLLILLSLMLSLVAYAQGSLSVNGQLSTYNTDISPDIPFVEASHFADLLGASYYYASGNAVLERGDSVLRLSVHALVEGAVQQSIAELNGQPMTSVGAVIRGSSVYLPAIDVARALGFRSDLLPGTATLLIVGDRATIEVIETPETHSYPDHERFVFRINSGGSFTEQLSSDARSYILRFEQSDMDGAQRFQGRTFDEASLVGLRGYVEFRVTARTNYRVRSYSTHDGGAQQLIVDIVPEIVVQPSPTPPPSQSPPVVLIDPSHGGANTGIYAEGGFVESVATLRFSQRLAEQLFAQGISARLTRDGDYDIPIEDRSERAVGVPLFISVNASRNAQNTIQVYYLDEADSLEGLDHAFRENAAHALSTQTSVLRRSVLLGLVEDLPLGARYARDLSRELSFRVPSYSIPYRAAPIVVLRGAAGRGLFLELSPQDLNDDDLVRHLADSIAVMLASR